MFLAMMENYLIVIMESLGGNSSHVGIALFISSMVAAPAIFFFGKVQEKIKDTNLLKIAALSFLVRAVCLYFSRDIRETLNKSSAAGQRIFFAIHAE